MSARALLESLDLPLAVDKVRDLNPFELLVRVRRTSPRAANLLATRIVPRIIPMAKGLGVKVCEMSDTRCVLSMPVSRRTRNHLKALYFGAQMTLADLTVGLLLFQRFPPGPFGGVIKQVEAQFKAKGKGLIRCECDLDVATIDALEAVRHNESGKAEAWVPARLVDKAGVCVTEFRCLVAIKRFLG